MNPALIEARAQFEEWSGPKVAIFSPGARQTMRVLFAEQADRLGDESDKRRLAGALTDALLVAVAEGNADGEALHSARLLGVLSEAADLGDEDLAAAINVVAPTLSPAVVGMAAAYARQRKAIAHG